MSQFISNDNQTLLYEMIHKDPAIHTAFANNLEQKNRWFRSVIERFYKDLPKNITREELKGINRQVLAFMIRSLNDLSRKNTSVTYNTLKREQAPDYDTVQKQYNSMFETPKPTSVDFGEKVEDTAITNMDELIERHKKQREIELQEYKPAPTSTLEDSSRVKILQDVPERELRATVIPDKKVQFNLPTDYTHLSNEIDAIKTKLEHMNDTLLNLVELIKQGIIHKEPDANSSV
jgi:hypothetical protein